MSRESKGLFDLSPKRLLAPTRSLKCFNQSGRKYNITIQDNMSHEYEGLFALSPKRLLALGLK